MARTFKYNLGYCPYCYTAMPNPTEFCCNVCDFTITNEKDFITPTQIVSREPGEDYIVNTDYRGLPMCRRGHGVMRIKCPNPRCEEAHNLIPPTDTKIVVIAGMRSTGKSTYLLDLVNSDSDKTGVIVSPKSHRLIKWRDAGIKTLEGLSMLDGTEIGNDNFSSVVGMGPKGKAKEVCISITDRPGEESQDLEKMLGIPYMYCADYVILLIDLFSIKGVKSELNSNNVMFDEGIHSEDVPNITALDNIIAAIEAQCGKKGRNIPFFVGVSKWDFAEEAGIGPSGFSIGCNGSDVSNVLNSKGKFDKKKWVQNSNAIEQFLIRHGESEYINKAKNYFKTVYFFAFSNYGSAPQVDTATGLETQPVHNPRHTMDPFYYILNQNKLI